MHELNIIHRDIKPENLLVNRYFPVIINFYIFINLEMVV